ncbi:MAG: 3-hydroxyacyl-ACP dehydratase FabZ family protein [Gammaproteobacteria bacterium]
MYINNSIEKKYAHIPVARPLIETTLDGGRKRNGADRTVNLDNGATLFDLSGIDLSNRIWSSEDISNVIPHRSTMALLDWIVWENHEKTQGIALKQVSRNEFWVPGHFPSQPIMPGVLMIEAGAQLACFLVNRSNDVSAIGLFLHIEQATFRTAVKPDDQLYILCRLAKKNRRMYVCDLQGVTHNKIAFDATIVGMSNFSKTRNSSD